MRAPFELVAAFAPGMVARDQGSIVDMGSLAGSLGLAGAAAYDATTAALASMNQASIRAASVSGEASCRRVLRAAVRT